MRDRLRTISVPLDPGVPTAVLDLQANFDTAYDAHRFRLEAYYTKPPDPPLGDADAGRARESIAARA